LDLVVSMGTLLGMLGGVYCGAFCVMILNQVNRMVQPSVSTVLGRGSVGLVGGVIIGSILGCYWGWEKFRSVNVPGYGQEGKHYYWVPLGALSGAGGGSLLGLCAGMILNTVTWRPRPPCARCGQRAVTQKADGESDFCSVCDLRARVSGLPDEQREAIRRLARSGEWSDAIQEAQRILDVSPDDAAFVTDELLGK
jgi:hypothetical protein